MSKLYRPRKPRTRQRPAEIVTRYQCPNCAGEHHRDDCTTGAGSTTTTENPWDLLAGGREKNAEGGGKTV